MKKRTLCLLLIITFLVGVLNGCGKKGGEEISLVSGGATEYVIVHAAEATKTEINVAKELQAYLNKISGVTLEIVTDDATEVEQEIVVGKTNREDKREFDREELGEDGFVIKTEESSFGL